MSILTPARFWSRVEVMGRGSPVPRSPGVYGWYFKTQPGEVPVSDCHMFSGFPLLYVGIAPKAPPTNGRPASRQSLASRVKYHFRGNAEGSTLRLTLGCLLSQSLGIALRRVGSGNRLTFTKPGEERLDAWMAENAFVCWQEISAPWNAEEELIRTLSLPLNLAQNRDHPFHQTLKALRASSRRRARDLPIVTG